MYMNLAASFEYLPDRHTPDQMCRLLDACGKRGMKVLITDHRTHWMTLEKEGEEGFRKRVCEAVADFGHHPAAFAFLSGTNPQKSIGDPPNAPFRSLKNSPRSPRSSTFCRSGRGTILKSSWACAERITRSSWTNLCGKRG